MHQKSEECQEFCDTRSNIVVKDKGKSQSECRFNNKNGKCVCLIRVDGCIIQGSETKKCDYLFLVCNETEKSAFLVELKGKDLEHAFKQILSTIEELKKYLNGFCLYARIAVTRVPNYPSGNAKKTEKEIIKLLQKSPKGGGSGTRLMYRNSNTFDEL